MPATSIALPLILQSIGLPPPAREYRFAPPRRWRFDYAWPSIQLALEIEGGTWTAGRHVRGKGYENDCAKYNAAALAGWRVLRVTTRMIRDGRALALLQQAFSAPASDCGARPVCPTVTLPIIDAAGCCVCA